MHTEQKKPASIETIISSVLSAGIGELVTSFRNKKSRLGFPDGGKLERPYHSTLMKYFTASAGGEGLTLLDQ